MQINKISRQLFFLSENSLLKQFILMEIVAEATGSNTEEEE